MCLFVFANVSISDCNGLFSGFVKYLSCLSDCVLVSNVMYGYGFQDFLFFESYDFCEKNL
ncbi:hypothetical protein OF001_U180087 [Pseudomonas sp. OF001]|nr:hypothetical protein OF001_U180087 [Pseudomonas sp. OF001]